MSLFILPYFCLDVEDMRIDWVTGNIYFLKSDIGQIIVCNKTETPKCTFLISNSIGYPYLSFALDAHSAYVQFYSSVFNCYKRTGILITKM